MKPMADEQPPSFQFEDVPLNEARRMGRGPRMEPMLYDTLRHKIQSLSTDATPEVPALFYHMYKIF
jgi:hypothetical protein